MTDRLIRITTALAVVTVAVVAAVISYQHAYELVRSHGESGLTARLVAVHDGRADLGGVHGGTGCQPVPRLGHVVVNELNSLHGIRHALANVRCGKVLFPGLRADSPPQPLGGTEGQGPPRPAGAGWGVCRSRRCR